MKVGIIGGGASGLVAAWLLDNHCDVVLFEKKSRLGGHAQTVYVPLYGKNVPIEIGFEFFNLTLFPYFSHLLNLLEISTRTFPLTYTFYTADNRTSLVLPPCSKSSFLWKTLLPQNLITILQFNYLMKKGEKIVNQTDYATTLQELADSLYLSDSFKNNFLYPFLASGWGATINDFKSFSAYDILKWINATPTGLWPEIWSEIVDGTSAYIHALSKQLTQTKIKLASTINTIHYENQRYFVQEANGTITEFDHLILATDPQEAHLLLKNIDHATQTRLILEQIECFPTTVAVHGDPSFMPKNRSEWSVTNILYTGKSSAITVYKPWKTSMPIFRSWIINNDTNQQQVLPKPLYAVEHFHHQKVTPNYFKAQAELKKIQGAHNVWLIGTYTHDIDSHENAIVSALLVAAKLAPDSNRLRAMKIVQSNQV